jgi:hypothetical protein
MKWKAVLVLALVLLAVNGTRIWYCKSVPPRVHSHIANGKHYEVVSSGEIELLPINHWGLDSIETICTPKNNYFVVSRVTRVWFVVLVDRQETTCHSIDEP